MSGTNAWGQQQATNFAIPMETAIPLSRNEAGQVLTWVPETQSLQYLPQTGATAYGAFNASGVYPADSIGKALQTVNAVQLADYASMRAYAGTRESIYVTGFLVSAAPSGVAGMFVLDNLDISSVDNGGTLIVTAGGKRYKRSYTGPASIQWFGAVGVLGRDNWADIQRCIDACPSVYVPNAPSFYETSKPLVVRRVAGTSFIGETREGAVIKKMGVVTSGEASVLSPAGLQAATLDSYNVDAVLIIKAPAGDFNRDVHIDKLTLRRDTLAGYGFYAPRISLSSFKDLEVFGADKGIHSVSPWMINWTRCGVRNCNANWLLGDANATNGGGTSNTLLSCWAGNTAIGRVAYDISLAYSSAIGCGADYIGYDPVTNATGPTEAIWKFTNSSMSLINCATEEARGPIVLATNSTVNVIDFHTYHYFGNWTGQPYQYAFVARDSSVVTVESIGVVLEGATTNIKWGLSTNSSFLEFKNCIKVFPAIHIEDAPLYAPDYSANGFIRITDKKSTSSIGAGGVTAKANLVTDGSFGSNFGQGFWNSGHLQLGRFRVFVDNATGQLKISDGVPASVSSGTFIAMQSAPIAVNAAATDLTTVIALTNQIRAALIAKGTLS